MDTQKTDVLVIGAGPAGSIAAAMINKAGYKVKVVEREKFPRFVIGESLLPRCMEVLNDADLLEAVKAKNFQQKFGAKFLKDEAVADFNFSDQYTKGWNWTWQVPRAEFDLALAEEVQKRGVPIDFETTVTDIQFNEDESSVTTVVKKDQSREKIEARYIIDASGYGRVIPRMLKFEKISSLDPRMAVFCHVEDPRRNNFDEPNRIIVVVYRPGVWVWVIPFSNGNTSVGFVGNHEFFAQYKGDISAQFDQLIAGHAYLNNRFHGVNKIWAEPRKLESWSSNSDRFYGKGYVLTGNVTEFLDPIFSSGVMFATVSSHLASQLVIRKLQDENIDWENQYTRQLQSGVDTFRAYVTAWYDGTLDQIFFAKDPDLLIKQQICSVLAGYVWDQQNPYVRQPENALRILVKKIKTRDSFVAPQ